MHRKRLKFGRLVMYAVLIVGSLFMAFPLLYGFFGSLCSFEEFYNSPLFPFPRHLYLENYRVLFTPSVSLGLWVANTLVRIGWYILIPGTVAVFAGYAFARLQARGRDAVFLYLLSSMMLPGIVYFIPTYIMLARFPGSGGNNWLGQGGHGFINEWPALLLTGWVNVYYIFLLRQTYYSIPSDFEEAARVDGAGTLRVLWDVYLPMLKPTLTVLVIFQFVSLWNDYQWPLIVSAGNPKITTLALGVQRTLLSGAYIKKLPPSTTDWPFAFALAMVATLPTVLLFLWLQSYFVEGVQGFALKG